jgi:thioredoxin-like negative regulator of GroEL
MNRKAASRSPDRAEPPLLARVVAALALVAGATDGRAAPPGPGQLYVPASDSTVLEHLPSTRDPRVRRFDAIRRQAAARPRDPQVAIALANAYLDYGRDTGDARYLGRAQAVLVPWLARRPPSVDALLVHATILQSRHQFADSRRVLQSILQRDPDNSQAWLTLSAVALVQGDMGEAQRDCAQLLGDSNALVAAGCIAARATVTGHAADALHLLETLLPQQQTGQSPVLLAWAHGLMADAAKALGQTQRADAEFKAALQLTPGDNFLIADYADFLLDNGRAREALELTRPYPQSDTSFLRQAMAEAVLRLPGADADIATMASRFRDLEQRGDSRLYAREEARFALWLQHEPTRALALAQANWVHQRAPEDVRIYLEAALAAGRPPAAQPVLQFLDRTQLEDPKIRALATQVRARMAPATTEERR